MERGVHRMSDKSNAFGSINEQPCVICDTPTSNDPSVCSARCEATYNEQLAEKEKEAKLQNMLMQARPKDGFR